MTALAGRWALHAVPCATARLRPRKVAVKRLVLALVALLIALPTAIDAAQGDDTAYCAQLAAMYRRYVQNGPGKRFDVEASVALDDCGKGKTVTAIPVLEKKLRESGFSLPEEFKP
jgi:hypothetical protein